MTSSHRMILHKDGYVELYDHHGEARETRNVAAQNPALVEKLRKVLDAKMKQPGES